MIGKGACELLSDILTMKDYKRILTIALPAMAENFLQMLMGVIDSYLVASLGLVAISGVAVASNMIIIYQAIFIALGAAVASLIAKSKGRRDERELGHHATEAIKLTLALSTVLGLVSVFLGRPLLSLLGAEPQVIATGSQFLALVGGGIVFLGLMTTLGALVRVSGKPRLPMYASLLSNILNALISSLGIFVFGWGLIGVALGTVISRLIGAYLLWSCLELPFARPSWGLDKELLNLALPAAGERLMMRAGDVVVISLIVQFGTEAVAGNSIGEVLTQFIYMPVFGIATAAVMLVAQAMGQADWGYIERLRRMTYWLSLAFMLPLALGIWLFGNPLTRLFTQNPQAVAVSVLVALFSLLCVPMTAGTVIYTALWQGLGNAKLPFYATSVGMWLIRIGMGYLLGFVFHLGIAGVFAGTLLDNGFRWLFLSQLYRRKEKENI